AALRETQTRKPFAIAAIVVLPEHLHAIFTLPPGDCDFSGRWKMIKTQFTKSVVPEHLSLAPNKRGEDALWQRRFWEHTIRDERDFERCANYVHFNPVKHGLVSTPSAWPFTSLHRYVQEGILPKGLGWR